MMQSFGYHIISMLTNLHFVLAILTTTAMPYQKQHLQRLWHIYLRHNTTKQMNGIGSEMEVYTDYNQFRTQ